MSQPNGCPSGGILVACNTINISIISDLSTTGCLLSVDKNVRKYAQKGLTDSTKKIEDRETIKINAHDVDVGFENYIDSFYNIIEIFSFQIGIYSSTNNWNIKYVINSNDSI